MLSNRAPTDCCSESFEVSKKSNDLFQNMFVVEKIFSDLFSTNSDVFFFYFAYTDFLERILISFCGDLKRLSGFFRR